MMAPTDRRTLLSGFAKLPLIGGALTIVGAPSAPVSLVQAATLSGIDDPRERARHAWTTFAAAMDDVTAGTGGWRIVGAGDVRPCGYTDGGAYLRLAEVHYEVDRDPLLRRPLVVERHREIALDDAGESYLRQAEAREAKRLALAEGRA